MRCCTASSHARAAGSWLARSDASRSRNHGRAGEEIPAIMPLAITRAAISGVLSMMRWSLRLPRAASGAPGRSRPRRGAKWSARSRHAGTHDARSRSSAPSRLTK